MSNYNHPYCTIDKLRISKANGIRFTYITDEEGSFFDGENIPDNTPYNDLVNCGFVVPPFQQKIPCGGIARFQFQWCDDLKPYVHVFKNGIFDYELQPSLILDGEYQIFEQELNFDATFCDSCVELRICTKEEDWFSILSVSDSFFYGENKQYIEQLVGIGYTVRDVSVYGINKALILAESSGTTTVYSFIDGVFAAIFTQPLFAGDYIKAFDERNWIAVNSGTSNTVLFCKNGSVTLETTTINTYFYGIDGISIDEIYGLSRMPFSDRKLVRRNNEGTWSAVFESGNAIATGGKNALSVAGRVAHMLWLDSGTIKLVKVNLDNYSVTYESIASDTSVNSISYLDKDNAIISSNDNIYIYKNGIDATFNAKKIGVGDMSNIVSISYQGTGLIMVNTSERLYSSRQIGIWQDEIGTSYPFGNTYQKNDGKYKLNYRYHAKSEPIRIEDVECLKKIEYWNQDDYDYQTFCQGFRNVTYIQAQIIGFKPIEESEVYITSNNVKRVISSNLGKISNLDINYIPEYLHEILLRAFGMSSLEIDGKSFTKNGDYNINENPTQYALWKANIELYENLYKFANSNCDESC